MKSISVLIAVLIVSAIIASNYINLDFGEKMTITIGYPAFWGPLVPAQQCTAYGDSVLSNQFEALVRIGQDHLIHPLAAKSWIISDDFKKITFKIDTSKKFSNGEALSAQHFKKSWEYGVQLETSSHNESTLEILSYIEGFDQFKDTGEISGIVTVDNETLVVNFTKSFRLALDNFAV